jgi:hypothetical protein
MKADRLIKSLSALSVVAMLAVPVAAFAMPNLDRSGGAISAPARNHVASAGRAVYYAAKERQMEQMEHGHVRLGPRVQRGTRSASIISYTVFKEQQIERILNGE